MGKVADYLVGYFESVYCPNCKHASEGDCDDCHRKAMGWGLSKDSAEEIERKILEIVKEDG